RHWLRRCFRSRLCGGRRRARGRRGGRRGWSRGSRRLRRGGGVGGGASSMWLWCWSFSRRGRRCRRWGLSLFHIVLPVVLIWLVWRLGYDRRALLWQMVLGWLVLVLTYFLTKPQANINWVYGWGGQPQQRVPPLVYLGIMMV